MQLEKWYDRWKYEQIVLPSQNERIIGLGVRSYPEYHLGWMHTYADPATNIDYRLWMYVALLDLREDIPKLIDVAERGDAIARSRAITSLNMLAPREHRVVKILSAWYYAKDYTDTIDVSKTVLYRDSDFRFVQRAVNLALMQSDVHDYNSNTMGEAVQVMQGRSESGEDLEPPNWQLKSMFPRNKSSKTGEIDTLPKTQDNKRGIKPQINMPKPSKRIKLPKPKTK